MTIIQNSSLIKLIHVTTFKLFQYYSLSVLSCADNTKLHLCFKSEISSFKLPVHTRVCSRARAHTRTPTQTNIYTYVYIHNTYVFFLFCVLSPPHPYPSGVDPHPTLPICCYLWQFPPPPNFPTPHHANTYSLIYIFKSH